MLRAKKWFPHIDRPCAEISFGWRSKQSATFTALLHFSRVAGGLQQDLEISFSRPLAVSWEDESWGLIETPQDLPVCAHIEFTRWTHPLLLIEGSGWRELYANRRYTANDQDKLKHYFLVSMNDLLHVLSESEPVFKWVRASDA